MLALNLPAYDTKITVKDGKQQIFDTLRRCYVALTPEEWVRQHFVHYLLGHKGYLQALMSNEVAITLNGTNRRCDTVVYDKALKPRMIIEYKAPTVKIAKEVFAQISRYNLTLRVDYLIVSNGLQHYCCKMDYKNNSFTFLQEIPEYNEVCDNTGSF
ncbi:MAG: type I restriction enzyme HsdR N-terminal domain-containing protein [Bacteroidaceae bacterium]|nr:type I restriction enzyme HsdR N-terminal domain-containing protein [Bacteroidaceae bacterium]